jgi:hypothetical protein
MEAGVSAKRATSARGDELAQLLCLNDARNEKPAGKREDGEERECSTGEPEELTSSGSRRLHGSKICEVAFHRVVWARRCFEFPVLRWF